MVLKTGAALSRRLRWETSLSARSPRCRTSGLSGTALGSHKAHKEHQGTETAKPHELSSTLEAKALRADRLGLFVSFVCFVGTKSATEPARRRGDRQIDDEAIGHPGAVAGLEPPVTETPGDCHLGFILSDSHRLRETMA
jgi:hypothetical protein